MKLKKARLIDGAQCWLCPSCRLWKPDTAYYRCKRSSNGLKSHCKPCHLDTVVRTRDAEVHRKHRRVSMRKARDRDPEKYRERERVYSRSRARDEKYFARAEVHAALRSGAISRPDQCGACGRFGAVEAHHLDYAKPLDVQWLCPECHGKEHRNAS